MMKSILATSALVGALLLPIAAQAQDYRFEGGRGGYGGYNDDRGYRDDRDYRRPVASSTAARSTGCSPARATPASTSSTAAATPISSAPSVRVAGTSSWWSIPGPARSSAAG